MSFHKECSGLAVDLPFRDSCHLGDAIMVGLWVGEQT